MRTPKLRRQARAVGLVVLVALVVVLYWPAHVHHAQAQPDPITLNPSSGPPGTTVTITPNAGTVDTQDPAGTQVAAYFFNACDGTTQQGTTGSIGSGGSIPTLTLTIPTTAAVCASSSQDIVYIGLLSDQSPIVASNGSVVFTTFPLTGGSVTGTSPTPTATGTPTATATPTTPVLAITVHGLRLQASINSTLSGVTVGTFTDDEALPASTYTVTIDWGDGTAPSSAATLAKTAAAGAGAHPAGVAEQYAITGSHTYTSTGIFPIDVTIQASDGRTGYLTSNADVAASSQTLQYQLSAGWNLLAPQETTGTLHASAVLAAISNASNGQLAAIYGLTANRWTPSLVQPTGKAAVGTDFTLQAGAGYLIYTDKQATVTLSAAASPRMAGAGPAIRIKLGPKQHAQLPPVPALP